MKIYEKPYFMINEDWYYYDEEELCYKLTEKAPDKVKESYEEFYKQLNRGKK